MENKQDLGAVGLKAVAEDELVKVAAGSKTYLRYECKICGACYRSDKELKKHYKTAHPNDPRAK